MYLFYKVKLDEKVESQQRLFTLEMLRLGQKHKTLHRLSLGSFTFNCLYDGNI